MMQIRILCKESIKYLKIYEKLSSCRDNAVCLRAAMLSRACGVKVHESSRVGGYPQSHEQN